MPVFQHFYASPGQTKVLSLYHCACLSAYFIQPVLFDLYGVQWCAYTFGQALLDDNDIDNCVTLTM